MLTNRWILFLGGVALFTFVGCNANQSAPAESSNSLVAARLPAQVNTVTVLGAIQPGYLTRIYDPQNGYVCYVANGTGGTAMQCIR